MNDFKVNFAGLEQASADIKNSGKQLRARLDRLDQDLAPLRSDWTGAAADSYQQSKAKWTRAIEEMNQLLDDIGNAVGASGQGYQQSESGNQNRWS